MRLRSSSAQEEALELEEEQQEQQQVGGGGVPAEADPGQQQAGGSDGDHWRWATGTEGQEGGAEELRGEQQPDQQQQPDRGTLTQQTSTCGSITGHTICAGEGGEGRMWDASGPSRHVAAPRFELESPSGSLHACSNKLLVAF